VWAHNAPKNNAEFVPRQKACTADTGIRGFGNVKSLVLQARRAALWTFILAVLPILTSCGGGGGGGGESLIFTPNQTSVTFDMVLGQTPPSQVVTVGVQGQYSGTLYVLATETGQGISPVIPITATPTSAAATLSVTQGLAVGTYSGQIQFKVCSDSACANQIGNSPITISYTVNVHAPLTVSPAQLDISVASGEAPTQTISVQLPYGANSFTAVAGTGAPWLTVTNVTSSSFTVALAALPSGSYVSSVLVTAGASSFNLPVRYTVTAPPGGDVPLSANPTSLTLSTVEHASATVMLGVTPPSWNPQVVATTEYPSSGPSGWLTVTPATGGEQVLADASALSAGSYTATIRLHGAYPSSDVIVPVALTVGVGLVRPADVTVPVGAETTATALAGSVQVNVASGPATQWSASSSAPWLTLTKNSGMTGQSLAYSIDPAYVATVTNGSVSSAQVTITPALTSMTPVTFNVNLGMNLPRISTLAPYVQLTGKTARVILRGSGFSSISSLASRITIDGSAITSATLVNDTEVIAQFAPLSAGAHSVSVSNALGLSTDTGSVVAVTEPVYAYAVISTGGFLPSLAYDPERDALYAVNKTAGSVMAFQYSGTSWSTRTAPLTGAFDLGLSQDGRTVLVTANQGNTGNLTGSPSFIGRFDPVALTTIQSASLNQAFQPAFDNLGFGIQTTNNGRSWLGLGTGQFDAIAYVTPQSLAPQPVTIDFNTTFSSGPWFAMSRDGERLIITQGSAVSPFPPMLYLNAADGVVRQNPAGLTFSYQFSVSETGDRVLLDGLTLLDGSFSTVGQATLPQNYFQINGQVSPDGSRAFVLAVPTQGLGAVTPRVFVFDATTQSTNLSLLGYFDLPDTLSCETNIYGDCGFRARGTIGLNGQTLFFHSNSNLYIVPVPTTLSQAPASQIAVRSQRRATPVPWPVNVH
jgi:hypothetical protein